MEFTTQTGGNMILFALIAAAAEIAEIDGSDNLDIAIVPSNAMSRRTFADVTTDEGDYRLISPAPSNAGRYYRAKYPDWQVVINWKGVS